MIDEFLRGRDPGAAAGAQAAFFLHGFLLSLQLGSGTHPGPADLRPTMDPSVADRLRGLCTARLTAAMTLALVTEMTSAQLCQLNLADIAADADAYRLTARPNILLWPVLEQLGQGALRPRAAPSLGDHAVAMSSRSRVVASVSPYYWTMS